MGSLQLLIFQLLIIAIGPIFSEPFQQDGQEMKSCPNHKPITKVNIDQLLGKWFLAIMVIEAEHEEFIEDNICIHGELLRYNKTMLKQIWNFDNPLVIGEHSAVIELPTVELENGVWSVQSPLGGDIRATIIDTDPDKHLILVFCGLTKSKLSHLWTVVVTRQSGISAPETLRLSAMLVKHGYNPLVSKIVSWKDCPIYTMIP